MPAAQWRIEYGKGDINIASAHAVMKSAWEQCPYGDHGASEEHALTFCINQQDGLAFEAISVEPANGAGPVQLGWHGSVCQNIWDNDSSTG